MKRLENLALPLASTAALLVASNVSALGSSEAVSQDGAYSITIPPSHRSAFGQYLSGATGILVEVYTSPSGARSTAQYTFGASKTSYTFAGKAAGKYGYNFRACGQMSSRSGGCSSTTSTTVTVTGGTTAVAAMQKGRDLGNFLCESCDLRANPNEGLATQEFRDFTRSLGQLRRGDELVVTNGKEWIEIEYEFPLSTVPWVTEDRGEGLGEGEAINYDKEEKQQELDEEREQQEQDSQSNSGSSGGKGGGGGSGSYIPPSTPPAPQIPDWVYYYTRPPTPQGIVYIEEMYA